MISSLVRALLRLVALRGTGAATGILMAALGCQGVGLLLVPPPGSRAVAGTGATCSIDRVAATRISSNTGCTRSPATEPKPGPLACESAGPGPVPVAVGALPPWTSGDSSGAGVGAGGGRSAAMAPAAE